jgi:hypothetical protein
VNRVHRSVDQRTWVGPRSTVDRDSYPFASSNLSHQITIERPGIRGTRQRRPLAARTARVAVGLAGAGRNGAPVARSSPPGAWKGETWSENFMVALAKSGEDGV